MEALMLDCQDHEVCIESAMRDAEEICQEKGLRFTELRKEVLKLIWLSHIPAKAYDILEMLKGKTWSAKPPTVYRALDFLLENGLVHGLDSINAYIGRSHPRDHIGCYGITTALDPKGSHWKFSANAMRVDKRLDYD